MPCGWGCVVVVVVLPVALTVSVWLGSGVALAETVFACAMRWPANPANTSRASQAHDLRVFKNPPWAFRPTSSMRREFFDAHAGTICNLLSGRRPLVSRFSPFIGPVKQPP